MFSAVRMGCFLIRKISFSALLLMIAACSVMPESIQHQGTLQIGMQAVQQNPGKYDGQTVRWGGVITQVVNNEADTWIEILALDLNSYGRPSGDRKSNQGRFIAKFDQFIDPEVYEEGESITVIGLLSSTIEGKIGQYDYSFPVVSVQGHHLWSAITERYYPYITPGYWYYGYQPYWQFGYSYYGFGVRHHLGYYPYYPFFGYLDRDPFYYSHFRRFGFYFPYRYRFWPYNPYGFTSYRSKDAKSASYPYNYRAKTIQKSQYRSKKGERLNPKEADSKTRYRADDQTIKDKKVRQFKPKKRRPPPKVIDDNKKRRSHF